jgi:adhesin/invasin
MRLRLATSWLAAAVLVVCACKTDTAIGPREITALYVTPMTNNLVIGDTVHLHAVAVDKNGIPYTGLPAAWTTSNSGAVAVSSTGFVQAIAVGSAMIRATIKGMTGTAQVTVSPRPVIATAKDSVGFSTITNGPQPTAQRLEVTNAGGSTLTGVAVDSVTYGPGASNWLTATLSGSAAPDTLGLSASNIGLAIGIYSATVMLSAPKAANSPKSVKVTLQVGVGVGDHIAADSGNAQTANAGSAVPIHPSVIVRDLYNNAVPGVSVTFAVASGGGAVSPTSAMTTDANGRARVTSWTLGTTAGPNSLTATSGSLVGSPVTFTATGAPGPAAAITKAGGDGQSATVNTAVPTPPSAKVADQYGNGVPNAAVTFAVTGGGGSVTGASQTTDANGLATVGSWKLGTTAGGNALSATSGSFSASFSATGTAAAAKTIAQTGGNSQTDTVAATLAVPYTVTVSDTFGNPVSNVTATWAVTGGGTITPSSATGASGVASATRVLGRTVGPQGATATVSGLSGSPVSFTATATHGAATQLIKVAGDGQSATAGSAVAIPPAAKVTDQFGNGISGVAVTFAVASGGGTVSPPPTTPIVTGAGGVATVTSWQLGATAGPNTLTASAAGLTTVTFSATGNSGTAKNLLMVSGDAQTDTIGATLLPYIVKVTDINSNPVPNIVVSWQVTGGGGTITLNSTTDASGQASATRVLGSVVGPASAQASVNGLTGSPQTFNATVHHGNAAQLFKSAGDGQSATVNTAVATAPKAQVTDRVGNAIAGANVTFTLASGGGAISPATPATLVTDGSGFAQLTSWTLGPTAGSNTVTASSSGTPGATFSATGTPGPANAGMSTVVAATASITACSASCVAGSTASTITVTVKDQYSNVIQGASVTISSSGSGNNFPVSGSTDVFGQFAANFNSTVAQAKTISATASAIGITQTAGVTVNPAAVSLANSLVSAGTSPITACSTGCIVGSTASTITVTVRDQFSNVIQSAGTTPSCSVGTSCTFNPTTGSTNGSGQSSSSFNSTVAQGKAIQVVVTSVGTIAQTAVVTVNAAAPASVSVTNSGLSARVGTAIGTLPTYTVRDAFSNVVPSSAVTYASSTSGAFSGPTSTDASGLVTLTSWTMAGTAVDDASGLMANSVTLTAGSASGTATDYGVYVWSGDVRPLIGTPLGSACASCHSWSMGSPQDGAGTQNLVGFAGTGSCAAFTRIVASNAGSSMLYNKLTGIPCGTNQMPIGGSFFNATQLKIVRAWINNGAQNN